MSAHNAGRAPDVIWIGLALLEVTEIVLAIGFFAASTGWIKAGGIAEIVTAAVPGIPRPRAW